MSTEGATEAGEEEAEEEEEEEEEGAAVAVAARAISTRHDGERLADELGERIAAGKRLDDELGLVIFTEGPPASHPPPLGLRLSVESRGSPSPLSTFRTDLKPLSVTVDYRLRSR
jgi:hypothetical protein